MMVDLQNNLEIVPAALHFKKMLTMKEVHMCIVDLWVVHHYLPKSKLLSPTHITLRKYGCIYY
jgi:hypothetical protein